MFLNLEFFVMNFTCNDTDIIVMNHEFGEVLTEFNTNDIIEGVRFEYDDWIVEFVRPRKDGKLIIEVRNWC